MIKKEDLEREIESLPEEVVKNGYSKGYNPNDILCRMCVYSHVCRKIREEILSNKL